LESEMDCRGALLLAMTSFLTLRHCSLRAAIHLAQT
jgi:hypothetical protein